MSNGKQKLGEVVAKSTTTSPTGAVKETQENLGLVVSEGPIGEVQVALGYTKNLGNYQSARLDVSVRLPCDLTAAGLDKAFEFGKKWCDTKLEKLIGEIEATVSG